jgi:demethylmenaquinone methyltransferase/2-methoxy-6-polyprenyl-1,4-benzoquinol methylase
MFSRIARRYDLMNGLMTFGRHQAWRRKAARIAQPRAGAIALDVATGTGDLARALLEETGTRSVVGADFSEAMLALGREKRRRLNLESRLHLVAGDVLALPFPDHTFCCVTSAFLLRNLADLDEGLREMARVTQPGGRVVALETSNPTLPLFRSVFAWYFQHVVPLLGAIVSGDLDAYRYLPRTSAKFLAPDDLAEAMTKAGLQDVRYQRLALGTVAIHYGTV